VKQLLRPNQGSFGCLFASAAGNAGAPRRPLGEQGCVRCATACGLLHHSRLPRRHDAVNTPNPALVTQREAKRLPRIPLLLLCAAYLVPGLFGRDPWKAADISAFGYMLSIAEGRSAWWSPTLGGLPPESALLPYWIGAVFIKLFGPWLGAPLAARIPFAILLGFVLMLTWYAAYHLARTEAAQPLPLAFGGEATSTDYARAIADGALLALIATLGLLQLGHETTPEIVQLMAAALYLYALACSPFRERASRVAVLCALPVLAASGAPSVAIGLGAVGLVASARSHYGELNRFAWWIVAAMLLASAVAALMSAWAWRVSGFHSLQQVGSLMRLRLVHLACLAARAVDAAALAAPVVEKASLGPVGLARRSGWSRIAMDSSGPP
jgi:hypothetical protein